MNEMVKITRAEYNRLCKDAEDLRDLLTYDHAKDALESGEDELIPAEYVKRLVAGESAVRVYRELRGLTQQALADGSGVNRVQIADIEAGRKSGSIDTAKKLAAALGVILDDLV